MHILTLLCKSDVHISSPSLLILPFWEMACNVSETTQNIDKTHVLRVYKYKQLSNECKKEKITVQNPIKKILNRYIPNV